MIPYPYLISIVVGIIVASCFYKKQLWANRYKVLAIIAGLSLVSILALQLSFRSSLKEKTRIISSKFIRPMYVDKKELINNGNSFNLLLGRNWLDKDIPYDKINKSSIKDKNKLKDYNVLNTVLYFADDPDVEGLGNLKIGYYDEYCNQTSINRSSKTFFVQSSNNNAYLVELDEVYDETNNIWVIPDLMMPNIFKRYTIIYLPEKEYKALPNYLKSKPKDIIIPKI